MPDERTCVIFGAGALGLGFLGPELHRDYRLVFADISLKSPVLSALHEHGYYFMNESGPSRRVLKIEGVDALNIEKEPGRPGREAGGASLIFTAVGEPNLAKLAPVMASALEGRPAAAGAARILCCENGIEIAAKMRGHLLAASGGRLRGKILVGDTVMGRMCQYMQQAEPPWAALAPGLNEAVVGEPFFGMPVQEHAMRGLESPGEAFQLCSEPRFRALEDLKMFAHNGLHAFLGCLGHLRSKKFFHELTAEPDIMRMAAALLAGEIGPALLRKHSGALDRNEYYNYATTIVRRITCPGLRDSISRGTRGTMRKLEPWERLISGIRCVKEQGGTPLIYCRGVAAAVRVARMLGETAEGTLEVLTRHCGLDPTGERDLMELVQQGEEWLDSEFVR